MEEEASKSRRVTDPTANVIALVEANARAADDLRIADLKFNDMQHAHLKEISDLRSYYMEKLSEAEAKRLDAIRLVDVGAVTLANEKAGATAATLAKQVSEAALALSLSAGAKGVSTPLLLSIAAIAGSLVSFVVQKMIAS